MSLREQITQMVELDAFLFGGPRPGRHHFLDPRQYDSLKQRHRKKSRREGVLLGTITVDIETGEVTFDYSPLEAMENEQ